MPILLYFAIILSSVTQSTSSKAFIRKDDRVFLFNAIKSITALALFIIIAAFGFTFHLPTLFFGLGYGAALAIAMYAGFQALRRGPMAITSTLVSFSVVMPVIWGLTVGKEPLSRLQIVGLGLLLVAVLLINANQFKKKKSKDSPKTNYGIWLLFVAITFVFNGIDSILQTQHQRMYPGLYSREFMMYAMLFCAVVFFFVGWKSLPLREWKKVRGKRYAMLGGITNSLSSFFALLLASMENASVLFPIISVGTTLGVVLSGKFIFKEKLLVNHYIAIVVGAAAIVLLKL